MATEQQNLEEELALLKEMQSLRAQNAANEKGVSLTDLAQSFNTGLVDLVNLPSELINIPLGLVGAPQIPTEDRIERNGCTDFCVGFIL